MNENKKSIPPGLISDKKAKDLLEIFDYMETNVFDADWNDEQETVADLRPILKQCAGIFDIKKTSFKEKDPQPNNPFIISSEAIISPKLAGIDRSKDN